MDCLIFTNKGTELQRRQMGVGGQRRAPAALPLVRRFSTHCSGAGWIGGVWRRENLLPQTGLEPRNVAVQTTLFWYTIIRNCYVVLSV
jgi:hypothetical protein